MPPAPVDQLNQSPEARFLREMTEKRTEYESYRGLKAALHEVLEGHVKELPTQYDPVDTLIWGVRHGWLKWSENDQAVILVPEHEK